MNVSDLYGILEEIDPDTEVFVYEAGGMLKGAEAVVETILHGTTPRQRTLMLGTWLHTELMMAEV